MLLDSNFLTKLWNHLKSFSQPFFLSFFTQKLFLFLHQLKLTFTKLLQLWLENAIKPKWHCKREKTWTFTILSFYRASLHCGLISKMNYSAIHINPLIYSLYYIIYLPPFIPLKKRYNLGNNVIQHEFCCSTAELTVW